MKNSGQGIARDKAEEQPADKKRAQTVHKANPQKSVSREATRDPKLNDAEKTPGSGMTADESGDAPTG
ncbi:hypothetical protein [Bradyrhizobium sp. ARR65]|uniref:hypothetical protein n=1 Tax=Bradyrhizobium sp. ARR65 TaxID=1040989 RepID=UPI0004650A21|nr:hypothetical protein [Bradyrhizobium sp. ARR65]